VVPKDVLADLPAFVAVANRLSFRAAAEALGQTPAALSKAIGRLEARVGEPLLIRTTRRVELTQAGALLRVRAVEALALISDGLSAASTGPTVVGPVRVSASALLLPVIAPRLATLWHRHPGLAVTLAATDDGAWSGRPADLVLRLRPPATVPYGAESRRTAVLGALPQVTVAAPAYVALRGMPAAGDDPARHRWLHHAPDLSAVPEAARPQAALVTPDVAALMAACLAGAGMMRTIRVLVAAPLATGQLLAMPDRDDTTPLLVTVAQVAQGDEGTRASLVLAEAAQALGLPLPPELAPPE
jgi:DNA-binding transcriptional LysR family regulator